MNEAQSGVCDELPAMVFQLDAGRRILSVNRAVASQLGFDRASLVGLAFDDIVRDAGAGFHTLDTADGGRRRAVVAHAAPDAKGRSVVTAIMFPAAADAGQDAKLAALGQLAHHVVHELNQPLSVIRMAIGTARRKLSVGDEVDADFIDAKLERIDSQCVRAAAIVEYLRVFVPRNRAIDVQLDVNRAVENAVGMTVPKFRKLNSNLETRLGKACRVMGNEMHIEPALLCVLGEIHDRLQATGGGRPANVDVHTAPVGDDRVEIVVSDSAGARAAAAGEAGSSITLGMGIDLARELVAELGGTLDAIPGESGMTYRISLPVTNAAGDAGRQ